MAERASSVESVNDRDAGQDRGILGVVLMPFEVFGNAVKTVVEAVFRDGTLEAAGRQGIDELGAALKAFPDSIQIQEVGTIWHPTQGEIASQRDHGEERTSWSSLGASRSAEAEQQNTQQPEQGRGQEQDGGMLHVMPGAIAMKENQPLGEADGRSERRVPGLYQVWHANDLEAVHQSRMEREPYVHGYAHVASVEAGDLQHAVELTVYADREWRLNPEVKAAVVGSRDTAADDVIVDPEGRAYRFEGYRSFREVGAAALPLLSPGGEPGAAGSHTSWSSLGASRSAEAEQQNTPQPEQGRGQEQDGGMSM